MIEKIPSTLQHITILLPEISINTQAYIPLRRKNIRVGSWCWLGPPTPQFCVTYTNMLVSKNAKICITPDTKPKICVTPNAKPKCKSVEYRLRWVPNANFSLLALGMYISYFDHTTRTENDTHTMSFTQIYPI